MATATTSSNKTRELNRGAQTCETAIRNVQKEQSQQQQRLRSSIGKELAFKVKEGPSGHIVIPERNSVLDGYSEEGWKTGTSRSIGFTLYDGMEFTATVMKAGIDDHGRSYLVVAVGTTSEINHELHGTEFLYPGKEYQLFLGRIIVTDSLD